MGMLIRVNTFNDLSDANLAPTWGYRYGKGIKDDTFKFSNPYRLIEISDRFGSHAQIPNPPVKEQKVVTITKAYWFFSDERPSWIDEKAVQRGRDGHLLLHVDASFDSLKSIYDKLNKEFELIADGYPPIRGQAERGCWGSECYIRIPESEFEKMKAGISYKLRTLSKKNEYHWLVGEQVCLIKP